MGRGNRPVADARITLRIPADLRLLLEAIAVHECQTLSDTCLTILESHPKVAALAEMVYAGMEGTSSPP